MAELTDAQQQQQPLFVKGYKVDQADEYVAAFQRDGYVVIEDVLTEDERAKSIDEVWTYLEKDGLVKRDDETTWGNENWPSEVCRNGGFMGRFPYWKRMKKLDATGVNKQEQAWRNRENPRVYQAFANIMQTQRMWVSIDRYGVMRPAKLRHQSASQHENEAQILEEWQTKKEWLHWDLSPFHFGTSAAGYAPAPLKPEQAATYGSLRVQALISLVDCPEANGGFHCVPGFTDDRFFQWAEKHKDSYGALPEVAARNFIEVPDDDPVRSEIKRIPIKAGSLLIWNSQLPHGNFPNTGFDFRMVQYLKMIPVSDPREFSPAVKLQRFEMSEWFPEGYTPSPLGEMLYGIKDWPESEEEAAVQAAKTTSA
uniref:Phytanoyl-CoA dioxygenase n=1 Tax=Globisporangium ultimum (strain ATCC 200006 / CBS 805.95 / DAOM BR144) TaxID=431595 RepID=K3WX66_GLOUD